MGGGIVGAGCRIAAGLDTGGVGICVEAAEEADPDGEIFDFNEAMAVSRDCIRCANCVISVVGWG